MADAAHIGPDNVPGDWFVDRTCIDCGLCRWVAPAVFGEGAEHAYVKAQPGPEEREAASLALLACPVGSIGTRGAPDRAARWPREWRPGVWFLGHADRASYGAAAWLVVRPEGNVMVDVPRPVAGLLDRVEALGGVRTLFLTHRDDVGAHEKVAARFGAERVMHRADVGWGTEGVERKLDGDAPIPLAPDLRVVPVPGHTRGSIALVWKEEVLFSGDHVWGAGPRGWHAEGAEGAAPGVPPLGAGRSVCWWSWPSQIRSMERLLAEPFAHVLPGHGRPWLGGAEVKDAALRALIGWMKTV